MRERPILFNAPMVRAVRSGAKTQTRRPARLTAGGHVKEPGGHRRWHPGDPDALRASPFGRFGDRLWVRETWKPTGLLAGASPIGTRACGRFAYKADEEQLGRDKFIRWRPSIHMPRWASRISLGITGVSVQRVQDISEEDARAEGVEPGPSGSYRDGFRAIWDGIYGTGPGLGWDCNPWAWAVSFEQQEAE